MAPQKHSMSLLLLANKDCTVLDNIKLILSRFVGFKCAAGYFKWVHL